MFLLIVVIGIAGFAVQARLKVGVPQILRGTLPGRPDGRPGRRKMLRDNNIHNVRVTHVPGQLTDHFNPQTMTVNLSDAVCASRTAWPPRPSRPTKCSHAVQHAQGYAPLVLRSQLVPRGELLVAHGHVGHSDRPGHPLRHAERPPVLDRRGHDRHVGALLAGHAARGYNASARALVWLESSRTIQSTQVAQARQALGWAARTWWRH